MGRRKQARKKLPKRQKGKGIMPKGHESEPEKCATTLTNEADQESLAWDSLDEVHLPPTPSGAEYLPSADEIEVSRRLSCLNFSMLPCPDPAVNYQPSNTALSQMQPAPMSIDVDLFSLGGNYDILPSLSDREAGFGCRAKQTRKRSSRRKPNKRTKKCRYSLNNDVNVPKNASPQQPLYISFVRPTPEDPQFSRMHSFRRSRRPKSLPKDDPLLCIFSDTSVAQDLDVGDAERMDDNFNPSPPVAQCVGVMEGVECVEGALNDSDLSTTSTSDSGCEGDDEESSLEGPLPRTYRLSPSPKEQSSSEDEQFSQILHGAFPLMSRDSQKQFLELPEFKHPGRVRVSGGRKKRCKPPRLTNPLTLMDVNQRIVQFIQEGVGSELKFNLVSRAMCRTISNLANAYNLDCYIEQKRRLPVASPLLRKSMLTRIASRQEIEPILRNHGRESPTLLLKDALCAPMDTIEARTVLPRPLSVVGQGIPPLTESNIGNQMLRNMGWTPGTGLGIHGNGIQDPVKAELRPRKTGLGYS